MRIDPSLNTRQDVLFGLRKLREGIQVKKYDNSTISIPFKYEPELYFEGDNEMINPDYLINFYEIDGKMYLGEMTFTPVACVLKCQKQEDDLKLGSMLKIE